MQKWIIIATSFVIIGLILFAVVMTSYGWDFTKLSTVKFETNTYDIQDEFDDIVINTDTADVVFEVTDDKDTKVVCYDMENVKHSVYVEDGVLTVDVVDERKWYEYIGIFTAGSAKITVYIPAGKYGDLAVMTSTGDIILPSGLGFESIDISADTGNVTNYSSSLGNIRIRSTTGVISMGDVSASIMDLSLSTGHATLSGVTCAGDLKINVTTGKADISNTTCKNLISGGSTGDLNLKNVIAEEKFSFERSTGDIEFDKCDAAELFIETDTGDVEGTLLSDKVFIIETDTGNVDVPKTVTGGRCEIETDTGDIKIQIYR